MHYQRLRLHGDTSHERPRDTAQKMTERFWRNVVKGKSCWAWTARLDAGGYGRIYGIGDWSKAHRFSYELHIGAIPPEMVIDHICQNRACVNPEHLRLATRKQNAEHRDGPRAGSKSGVRGVSWDTRNGKWKAAVTHKKVKYELGYFDTINEAGEVARVKRNELYTHNNLDRRAS